MWVIKWNKKYVFSHSQKVTEKLGNIFRSAFYYTLYGSVNITLTDSGFWCKDALLALTKIVSPLSR